MRIHALNTGMLDIKHNYEFSKGGSQLMRIASAVLDSRFISVPVYTWVIEHPEGVIVIDTGMSAEFNDPDYFPAYQRPYWKSQYRFRVSKEDEIGTQLKGLGIAPQDVRWLILTHSHFDHTGRMQDFASSEAVLSKWEFNDVYHLRSAHFVFPAKWPQNLRERVIEFAPHRIGPFDESYTLTKAGDVQIVPTPGHTLGHQSVLLHADGVTYFFGGDTSFDLRSLQEGILDAPATSAALDFRTRGKIMAYANQTPLVYLTTHDPDTARRLEARETLRPAVADAVEHLTLP